MVSVSNRDTENLVHIETESLFASIPNLVQNYKIRIVTYDPNSIFAALSKILNKVSGRFHYIVSRIFFVSYQTYPLSNSENIPKE